MNYINIILLQDSDYSQILIDFQRFRQLIYRRLDQLEKQIKDYIQSSIVNKTFSNQVYQNIEKEFNFDRIIKDFQQHVKNVEQNKVDAQNPLDYYIRIFQMECNTLYAANTNFLQVSLIPKKPILISQHRSHQFTDGILTRKDCGDGTWHFATYSASIGITGLSYFKLQIIKGGLVIVGMYQRGMLEKLKNEWRGKGQGIYALTELGYQYNSIKQGDADFKYSTGDIVHLTYSIKSSELIAQNITTSKSFKLQLDSQFEYDFCVGLRYQTEIVQIL